MKIAEWLPFVFPAELRQQRTWIDPFGRSRRTYLLGFSSVAYDVGRKQLIDVHDQLSPKFKDDPRRVVPFRGWRERFSNDGEERLVPKQFYFDTKELKYASCSRWGSYGKDQPEHAWLKRPMRLYDALKSIAVLEDAADLKGIDHQIIPSSNGWLHQPNELSLHIAIYTVGGFTKSYYEANFANHSERLERLFTFCQLRSTISGYTVPTFQEMSEGMSATYRTCQALKAFCHSEELPELGTIFQEQSSRGTHRNERQITKRRTRTGVFFSYSADCVIEIFGTN